MDASANAKAGSHGPWYAKLAHAVMSSPPQAIVQLLAVGMIAFLCAFLWVQTTGLRESMDRNTAAGEAVARALQDLTRELQDMR